ncbi:hypothetical protein EVA_12053 [gut metagenome]|uniref:Uncharacterized protein n=1 Tax=gut metagenome TaxID=749906 RepID=J9CIF0_9ZZZZ
MLEFTFVVESRHCVVEVSCVSIAVSESLFDARIVSVSVCNSSKDAFACDVLTKLHSTWQFWSSVPAL